MDHEVLNHAKAEKLIASFIKLAIYAAIGLFFAKCSTAHAQSSQNLQWGFADPYYDDPQTQNVQWTTTCEWPTTISLDVQESDNGGAFYDLGAKSGQSNLTAQSNCTPNGADFTVTYNAYYQGVLVGTKTLDATETYDGDNLGWNNLNQTLLQDTALLIPSSTPWAPGTILVDFHATNAGSASHVLNILVDGASIGTEPVAPADPATYGPDSIFGTLSSSVAVGSHTWEVDVDGADWQNGSVTVAAGQTVEVNQSNVYSWPASTPTPSPSPTATPSPSPTATPSPTASPTASPNPSASPSATPGPSASPTPDGGGGASPTPSGDGGGGASPTPGDGGGGATPAPSGTPSDSGTGSGDNTEQEMEAAIQATFGNTSGAPVASSNDFQPTGTYTPAPDNTTAGLDSARNGLDGNLSTFTNMVPDLSGFSGLGTQYSFAIDCSGLGFGVVSLDFSPYQSGIQLIRALVLGMTALVLVIKFIKHMGPTL
jgi:hypothetical protein